MVLHYENWLKIWRYRALSALGKILTPELIGLNKKISWLDD